MTVMGDALRDRLSDRGVITQAVLNKNNDFIGADTDVTAYSVVIP